MRSQCKFQGMAFRGKIFLILAAICAKCQANSAVCNFDHSGKVREIENSALQIRNMKDFFSRAMLEVNQRYGPDQGALSESDFKTTSPQ